MYALTIIASLAFVFGLLAFAFFGHYNGRTPRRIESQAECDRTMRTTLRTVRQEAA